MSKKILLVAGANGQVATEYQLSTPIDDWDYVFLDKSKLDITKQSHVDQIQGVDAILNLAAYTNVERAEKEDTERAFNVNTAGSKLLAQACNRLNIPLIHISTDYVFDGESNDAYTETDNESPINQYGATKFLGEKWIQENHDWYYIIRVSWVYSNHSKNFFTTMLNLSQERSEIAVVCDQFGSPTSSKEICRAIDAVLKKLDKSLTGVYHFAGIGKTTWKDFAQEIFYQCKIHVELKGILSDSWPSKVKRPKNTYLSSEKFRNTFGYTPAHWKNALKEIILERKTLPVKVGDMVKTENADAIVVSTDWLKKMARVALLDNMNKSVEVPFDLLFRKDI